MNKKEDKTKEKIKSQDRFSYDSPKGLSVIKSSSNDSKKPKDEKQ